MLHKKLTQILNNKTLTILLALLAFLINYHYGFIGIMPMDNTVLFNGGYRVLKGYIPFNDYWLVTGPLLDYLNAFFFKLLDISWSTFIIHSSIFNSILAILSYYFFKKMNLSNTFSFIYSLLISILFYPVVGTPFVDHHSTFFVILAFYGLIIAIKNNNFNYLIIVPTLLGLSFLSKQTPAAYGIITIFIFILVISILNKKRRIEILTKSFIGTILALLFLVLFFLLTQINLNDFYQQYISFGSSIGKTRLNNYEFNLINEIVKFKFISFFLFFLIIIFIKSKIDKVLDRDNYIIIIISITLSVVLIFHQMISLNQNFIFFLIPFLCGISHSYYKKIFKINYLLIFIITICFISTLKYHERFNEKRKFNELENIEISKSVDAIIIDKKLKGLKWITYLNPNNPQDEINNVLQAMSLFKKEATNKMLITEYQIISPILDIYDNSPNQWHHPSVSFPLKGNKFFKTYKSYFISKIKKNNIETIFETREDENLIISLLLDENCLVKERTGKMLIKIKLNFNCKDLK